MDKEIFEGNIKNAGKYMTKNDMEGTLITPFAWRCIGNGYFAPYESKHKEDSLAFLDLWEKADDEKAFIDSVLESKELAATQGYEELFVSRNPFPLTCELPEWWWDAFHPEDFFSVWSEAGCVFLTDGTFTASYGFGDDGTFDVIILPKNQDVSFDRIFKFSGSVEGIFRVSGDEEERQINGRFGIYARRNMLVLKRWS